MKVLTTTPFLAGSPGESVTCHVRVENDHRLPSGYEVRIVGFGDGEVRLPASTSLPAGGVAEFDVELVIPEAFAPGNHALGVEVISDRIPGAGSVASVTVSVGSLDRLLLTVNPSVVRGHRSAKFWVDVLNRDTETVELELGGDSTDGDVRVKPRRVVVHPNMRVRARGRVSGRLRFFGEPRQLPFSVTAQGRSAPVYAPGTYQQRPLLPRTFRSFLAILLALALWASALGAGLWWWSKKNADEPQAAPIVQLVDVDGDGVAETPADKLVDTDSDGKPDTPAAQAAAENAAAAEEAGADAPKDVLPTFTVINGTVKAGETGQNDGVLVTLTPITLDRQPTPGAVAFAGARQVEATKLWPARYGVSATSGLTQVRQTTTLTDLSEGADGAFVIPEVFIRQTYEINFAKAGFDSQSYVVTPTEDGKAIEMEITLEPSEGALGGVVNGPAGPLGNVAITATDGTLTFSTTTDSAGSPGRFALPAVNTPATYTITATLRGYGTEVIQVALEPGDQRTNLVIDMRPGVGSIIGRVTAGGGPLGGATLTVANGENSRTSTSLTDGDVGLYNFPQLEIPETYTVTASAPGYITQTRLVELAGNATDVDFDLVKTTATITGLVRSDAKGPLAGATIAVSRDNLNFAVLSAAAPQAGAFTIDDLPPGAYLVTFSRYDHAQQSQLVNVTAGQVLDLGTITLTFTDVPVPPATGSISVNIVDSTANPLGDATVQILDVSTRDVIAEIDGDATQSSFVFQNVPVGTYIIHVERRLYNQAEQRISVGLGPAAATIPMFLLGQVSGRIIDSLTDQQLTDYEVSVSRVNADGSLVLIERIQVPANKQPNAQGRIIWESSPNSLTTGRYRVEVTDAPPGYAVAPDQILDPNNPTGPVMEFVISPTQEDPIVLNDIEADKYPVLKGRILKPLLTTPATNEVDYAPLDDDTLVVTVTCPGASGPLTATLTDEVGATPGLDTYTLTPIELETAGALGSCVIAVSATGFADNSITLDPPLAPSDGTTLSDRFVNIAVARPAESLGGTVFWVDRGTTPFTNRAVDGVRVATEGPVIVGFDDSTTNTPDGEPVPILAVTPLQSTSSAGSWALAGQIFGQSTYAFTDALRFLPGRMTVTIDETPPRAVASANAQTVVTDNGPAGVAVQLTPIDGRITGQVRITSVNPVRFNDARITATGPSLPTFVTGSTTDTYSLNARAGTWRTTLTMDGDLAPPDVRDYSLAPDSGPTSNTVLVNPGATVTLPTVSVIEHARAEVRIVDQNGQPIDTNGVRPQVTLTNGVGAPNPLVQTVGADGSTMFRRLAFSPSNPAGSFVSFAITVSMPGYDFAQSRVAVTGPFAGVIPNGSFFNGSASFGFQVVAGAKPIFTITVPRFGSLNGNVVGQIGSASENVPVGTPGVTIQGRRIGTANQFGQWRTTDDVFPAVVDPNDPDGFRISGPPGAYLVEIVHPDFDVDTRPPGAPICPQFAFCGADQVPFDIAAGRTVYLIANTVDTTFPSNFVLQIKRIEVHVAAVTASLNGTAIPDVSISLTNALATPATLTGTTNAAGQFFFTGVLPGTVSLTATAKVGADDAFFPVIATLDLKRFASSGDGIVDIVIVMPPLGQAIVGTVGAINSENDPVPLPASVTITRGFTAPAVDNDGVAADNDATDANVTPAPTLTQTLVPGNPAQTPVGFRFSNTAAGVHQLTFSAATGYTAPSPNPRAVTVLPGIETNTQQIDYRASDIQVVVDVTSIGQPLTTATVRLTSPDGPGDVLTPTSAANGRYTFAAVPPEVADYTLEITDPLHTTETRTVSVLPANGPTITVNVPMSGNLAQITGLALFDDTEAAGGTGPVTDVDSVQLVTTAGAPLPTPIRATPGADGRYVLSTAGVGDYRVQVSRSGYTTEVSGIVTATLGRSVAAADVTVLKTATATVTVGGLSGGVTPALAVTVAPTGSPAPSVNRTGSTFTITGLDPAPPNNEGYRFNVSAPGFYAQDLPSSTTLLNPDIGFTHVFTPTLVERTVTVTVTTVANPGDAANATVTLVNPLNNAALGTPERNGAIVTFRRIAVGSDAGRVTVTLNGYRQQVFDVNIATAPAAVTAALLPNATVSGTVRLPGGGGAGSGIGVAASNGASTTTGQGGAYTLTGFGVGTWTISAEQLGVGAGSANVNVTSLSPSTVTSDITLSPRSVTLNFTVTPSANPQGFTGATVTVTNPVTSVTANGSVNASGTGTVTIAEGASYDYTVTAAGFLPRTGTITLTALTQNVSVTVFPQPTVSGTITRVVNGNPQPQNNVSIYLCDAGVTTCDSTTDIGPAAVATTQANGTYTFRITTPGSYKIGAVGNGGNPPSATSSAFTVAANAAVADSTINLTIA